jgi:hypothetical protein
MEISEGFKRPTSINSQDSAGNRQPLGLRDAHPMSWTHQREMHAIGTVAVQLPGHVFDNSLRCLRQRHVIEGSRALSMMNTIMHCSANTRCT